MEIHAKVNFSIFKEKKKTNLMLKLGCDGVPNSGKKVDLCGICAGTNQTCKGNFFFFSKVK